MSTAQSEPARIAGLISAVVSAAVVLLVAFGLGLTEVQTAAITGFVAVVAPIVAGEITRRQVTPKSEVVAQVSPSGDFVAGEALVGVENGEVVNVDSLVAPKQGDVHITVTPATDAFADAVRAELEKRPDVT